MRALFYTAALIALASSVVVTVLLALPNWTAYQAIVVIDFARVSGITHDFVPNCASNVYELRWEVMAYTWAGFVLYALIGMALRHKRIKAENDSQYHERYIGWLWFGLSITTLPGMFIVATMSGVMTITVAIMLAFGSMLSYVLIGPLHTQVNEIKAAGPRTVFWPIFVTGVFIQVVYTFLLLAYMIQAVVWGHSVPWPNWAILAGDLVIRILMTVLTGLSWVGVMPLISKHKLVIALTLLSLTQFLWIPWFFFARTVTFTP